MEDNYNKAFKEVVEILKRVPKESVNKIPQDMRDLFEEDMDKNYIFEIKENVEFEDLELLDETKAILANIFRDYWATPYQKERIIAKEQHDMQILENKKREMYNPDDIFKKRKISEIQQETKENYNTNLPVEIKEEKFYHKLINFIKKLFLGGEK